MSIVWPCPIPVEAYAAAGRDEEVPVQACPGCGRRLGGWSGYWRFVRHGGGCLKLFVRRGRCGHCRVSHALLPAFCARNRLDVVETIGAALDSVAAGSGVAPVAAAAGVPYTTVRGWVRRFAANARRWVAAFAGLAVELGGSALVAAGGPSPGRGGGDRRGVGAGLWDAGVAGGRAVALRLGGVRRGVGGGQHELPVDGDRQTAFHAPGAPNGGVSRRTPWTTRRDRRWRCTVGR